MANLSSGDKNEGKIPIAIDGRARLVERCRSEILSDEEVYEVGYTVTYTGEVNDNIRNDDEVDEDVVAEYKKLADILDIPEQTHSLTEIHPKLQHCVKYGIRTGHSHFRLPKFSPLSRGRQGAAIAVAALATSWILDPHCWNESSIDQIVNDGDEYYCRSYKDMKSSNRDNFGLRDLKRELVVQNTHCIRVVIHDPKYAGTFRSKDPTKLHIVKALEFLFNRDDVRFCVLTSPVLDIAIWKDGSHFHVFDGQPRNENGDVIANNAESSEAAKLFTVKDLTGVLFVILEQSNVKDEPFVAYSITIAGVNEIPPELDDGKCLKTSTDEVQRTPSGYKIKTDFQAIVQGSYHLAHCQLPEEVHNRGHLVVALAALVYTRLVKANKWTTALINLIFNQAHVYFVDLVKAIGKKFDETFELKIEDLVADVILGVYTAKVKLTQNVVPGQGKKGKSKPDSNLREFFQDYDCGILDLKKTFYGVWKQGGKYYFLDPFACDDKGFRVDPTDPDTLEKFKNAAACLTMNSSINEMVQVILENSGCTEKDPFVLHGVRVLYIKSGSGPNESIVYRDKGINRRPTVSKLPSLDTFSECNNVVERVPKKIPQEEKVKNVEVQYPELMNNIELFFKVADNSETVPEEVELIRGYRIVNPHLIILRGTKNCWNEEINEKSKGRQGIVLSVVVIVQSKLKNPESWHSADIDWIITMGNEVYENVVACIQKNKTDKFDDAQNEEVFDKEDNNNGKEDDKQNDGTEKEENIEYVEETTIAQGNNKKKIAYENGLNYLDPSLLPEELQVNRHVVNLKKKVNAAVGNANPLVNLGECFEHYFNHYNELALENRKRIYAVWKSEDKYFLFNPYGSDEEGYFNENQPASLTVTDSINELTNLLYGILDINDTRFQFHFVNIDSIKLNEDCLYTNPIDIPGDMLYEYKAKFLPITDENFNDTKLENMEKKIEKRISITEMRQNDTDEKLNNESENRNAVNNETDYKTITEFHKDAEEEDQPDPPAKLNLFLVTSAVSVENDEKFDEEYNEHFDYDKLKYNCLYPCVFFQKKTLCSLLKAKLASKSAYSLLSRFSIDSKIAIKERSDLPEVERTQEPDIKNSDMTWKNEPVKLIKLPPKRYFFTKISSVGFTPIRAINTEYIQDEDNDKEIIEDCINNKRKEKENESKFVKEIAENCCYIPTTPMLIPLGPIIRTPILKIKNDSCRQKEVRKRLVRKYRSNDRVVGTIVSHTDSIIFNMIFPQCEENNEVNEVKHEEEMVINEEKPKGEEMTMVRIKETNIESDSKGFELTDDNNVYIIRGFTSFEDRYTTEEDYLKPCYFSAILCILGKSMLDVNEFDGSIINKFIHGARRMYQQTDKLKCKPFRRFYNIEIFNTKFNVILKQFYHADPENNESDSLENILNTFFKKHETGILIFANVAYAFWYNGNFHLFDSYSCDENGIANDNGTSCLTLHCNLNSMINRIIQNTGDISNKPYRLHTLSIFHIAPGTIPKKQRKETCSESKFADEDEEDTSTTDTSREVSMSEFSLIELRDWLEDEVQETKDFSTAVGFDPIPNYRASVFEVPVVQNDITRPNLAPVLNIKDNRVIRQKVYDRKFHPHTILNTPIDLCIMAWSCIYEPFNWDVSTVKGLYEISKNYANDNFLAFQDSSVSGMVDGILPEFSVSNYTFRVVFAPLFHGTLYAEEGWNLARYLKTIFEMPIYSGTIIRCGKKHIGTMRRKANFYAWWAVQDTKNLRIITSQILDDLLKLIVQEIDESEEVPFTVRPITISYAWKFEPDCKDVQDLHKAAVMPTAGWSLPEVYKMHEEPYDINKIFSPTVARKGQSLFVMGTVTIRNRDLLKEPNLKRCYFVALLTVMMKRDIVQNPLPGMVDKIIQRAEMLYKEFSGAKYHTEMILLGITLFNRTFDFRDIASSLVQVLDDTDAEKTNYFSNVCKHLKQYFEKHTSGIIHFTNCCYGFWYSRVTGCYYYLDPYPCNEKGRKVSKKGKACLGIFPSICFMVKHMCLNRFKGTTGFFIHTIHVESVNMVPSSTFTEDSMWVYLDYNWKYTNVNVKFTKCGSKQRKPVKHKVRVPQEIGKKPTWNYYVNDMPEFIYSLWGSIGCYDCKCEDRSGRNQAAIAVTIVAMEYLAHPDMWSPGLLDSAVMYGNTYYIESCKTATRRNCQYANRYNLQPELKISSENTLYVKFQTTECGILYGTQSGTSLASVLMRVFDDENRHIILECGGISLAVLMGKDVFYVADSSWVGPPLFTKHRAAAYVLRCLTFNALLYAIIKIFNTDKRLRFFMTPVSFYPKEKSVDVKCCSKLQKKGFGNLLRSSPGIVKYAKISFVPGAVAVSEEDTLVCYQKKLELGLKCGNELENPQIPSPIPEMKTDISNNVYISTIWRNNAGNILSLPQIGKPFIDSDVKKLIQKNELRKDIEVIEDTRMIESAKCNREYPKIIDFLEGLIFPSEHRRSKKPETTLQQPMICEVSSSFILPQSRDQFERTTEKLRSMKFKKSHRNMEITKYQTADESTVDEVSDEVLSEVVDEPTEEEISDDEELEKSDNE